MRDCAITKAYYLDKLRFSLINDYGDYLLVGKDNIEIHFFQFKNLDVLTNYGQVYIRVKGIGSFYNSLLADNIQIHPNASLETKPWGQKEFSVLDPDHNLLTFGEAV